MSNWLILLQAESEGPGNITKWLRELGQDYSTIKLWQEKIPGDFAKYDGLILMGGAMSANDADKFPFLSEEIKLIKYWINTKKPLLGICLGAQLMAKALGGKVCKGKEPEIGWFPIQFSKEGFSDPVFKKFSPETVVFQWHYDTFDLPSSTVLLASSNQYSNQSFLAGGNAYALQFHPEMNEELIYNWVKINHKKLLQMNPEFPQKILTETKIYLDNLEKIGFHLIKTLCDKID